MAGTLVRWLLLGLHSLDAPSGLLAQLLLGADQGADGGGVLTKIAAGNSAVPARRGRHWVNVRLNMREVHYILLRREMRALNCDFSVVVQVWLESWLWRISRVRSSSSLLTRAMLPAVWITRLLLALWRTVAAFLIMREGVIGRYHHEVLHLARETRLTHAHVRLGWLLVME